VRALLAAAALASAAGTAAAQSDRYPPDPVDADREAEERSEYWERALEPHRGRYDTELAQARAKLGGRSPMDLAQAARILDKAIELLPSAPDAYFLRGWVHELASDWARCADDYVAAAARDPDFVPDPNPRFRGPLADGLGTCLARAGRFEEAEAALVPYTATGEASSAIWLRLGEVYMALGRLDDALAALDRAADKARGNDIAPVRWLRATTLDRARRPAAAAEEAAAALRMDTQRQRVPGTSPASPTAPPEDAHYHAAIAYLASSPEEKEARLPALPAQPERAVLHLREYLRVAANPAWRKRAEEQLAAQKELEPADALGRPGAKLGATKLDAPAIGRTLRKDLAQLAPCLAKAPQLVAEVRVVIHGPAPRAGKKDSVVADRNRPPAGAWARVIAQVGAAPAGPDQVAALECLQAGAKKLKLPKLERGGWVQLVFPVIAR
jgi:tetratricopeptide (TPR) repeat protein